MIPRNWDAEPDDYFDPTPKREGRMSAQEQALRAIVEQWRSEARRHAQFGDAYRVGQGWGLVQCADELEARITTLLLAEPPPDASKEK